MVQEMDNQVGTMLWLDSSCTANSDTAMILASSNKPLMVVFD